MASYRDERSSRSFVAQLPKAGSSVPFVVYARVTTVVTSSYEYGPHLVVMRQRWSAFPPTGSDSGSAPERCYPSPGRAVGDYAVDEIIRLVVAHGAVFGEKLS